MQEKIETVGLKNTLHGVIYQLKLLMLFAHRAFRGNYEFYLCTEVKAAEKFDDLVLKYKLHQESEFSYRFLQAKHKQSSEKTITRNYLCNGTDDDFSVIKYFISYRQIKKNLIFNDGKHREFTICTNIGLDADIESNCIEDKSEDCFLGSSGKRYKIIPESDLAQSLKQKLLNTSDIELLARALFNKIRSSAKMTLKDKLFKEYHVALVKERVIDTKTKKFHEDFISELSLSNEAQRLKSKLSTLGLSKEEFSSILNLSSTFGKPGSSEIKKPTLPTDIISEEEVNEFLNLLVLAVNQPNEVQLTKIISTELGEDFNLKSIEVIYGMLEKAFIDWLKKKDGNPVTNITASEFMSWMKTEINTLQLDSTVYKHKLKELGINFKKSKKLEKHYKDPETLNYLIDGPMELGAIRFINTMEAIGYDKEDSYAILTVGDALAYKEKVSSCLGKKDFPIAIVCDDSRKTRKFIAELKKLGDTRNLVLISSNEIGRHYSMICETSKLFSELTEESKKNY
ncbi:MAG: hypothetical protein K0R73_1393 [Candidatus Midichloriaceae bacterium]|jgi:hypothetical protein|nr:hypothetical protein [Candidatus Midichloriaceae bacterium]